MLITNGTLVTPGLRRRTIQRQVSFGPITLRFVTVIVLAAAALVTLAQSTQSATKNYKVESLKKDLTTTQDEVDRMQFEATRLQSFREITGTQISPSPSASASPALLQPEKINYLPDTVQSDSSQAARVSSL